MTVPAALALCAHAAVTAVKAWLNRKNSLPPRVVLPSEYDAKQGQEFENGLHALQSAFNDAETSVKEAFVMALLNDEKKLLEQAQIRKDAQDALRVMQKSGDKKPKAIIFKSAEK